MRPTSQYIAGGTLQSGEGIYIERRADAELLALCRSGSYAYILTARQLGKSSLMVRTAQQLEAEGVATVQIDLTRLGGSQHADQWYLGLLVLIGEYLLLDTDVVAWWQQREHLGHVQRLLDFFSKVLLSEIDTPVVIFFDEIDTTIGLDYTDEFFAAIRALYNAREEHPELQRLSLVLIGVASPGDLIADPRHTPFNIGERVDLNDFTTDEAKPLATGLAFANGRRAEQVLGWVLAWTGGHPFLTQYACRELVRWQQDHGAQGDSTTAKPDNGEPNDEMTTWSEEVVEGVVRATFLGEQSEKVSNLEFVRAMLLKRPENPVDVLRLYRDIRRGWTVRDDPQSPLKAYLKLSGVVRREQGLLHVRNRIYAEVFNERWLRENWPLNWWASLPRGIRIAIVVVALLLVTTVALVERARRLEEYRSIRLLATSAVNLAADQFDLALLLSVEANRMLADTAIADDVELRDLLFRVLNTHPHLDAILQEHGIMVNTVAFLDEATIVSNSDDGEVIYWDMTTRRPTGLEFRARHHLDAVSVALSPNKTVMASWGLRDNTVHLWDAITGQPLGEPIRSYTSVKSLAFSPDGRTLAIGSWESLPQLASVTLWDVETRRPLGPPLESNAGSVDTMAFSPDGRLLATGHQSREGIITVWDITTDQVIAPPFKAHAGTVRGIAFSPDGTILASGGKDNLIRLWDVSTLQQLGEPLAGHSSWIASLAFSPDGQRLASSGWDGAIRLWDVATRRPLGEPLTAHQGIVTAIAFSPDGNVLASAGQDKRVMLWDVSSPLFANDAAARRIAVSPDGSLLVSGDDNGAVTLWDVETGRLLLSSSTCHRAAVQGLAFSPDGTLLASTDGSGRIMLWDARMARPLAMLLVNNLVVWGAAFNPDGTLLATGGDDGIGLWDVTRLKDRSLGKDGVCDNTSIAVWDEENYTQVGELRNEHLAVLGLAFSADGTKLAASGYHSRITVWDVATRQQLHAFAWAKPEILVGAVSFSPDGTLLVAGGDDHAIQLWNVTTGEQLGVPLRAHANWIRKVAFSPDGTLLATSSYDGKIRLWDPRTRTPIGQPVQAHASGIASLAFSPDSHLLISGSIDGSVETMEVGLEAWEARACQIAARNLTVEEWEQFLPGQPYHETC